MGREPYDWLVVRLLFAGCGVAALCTAVWAGVIGYQDNRSSLIIAYETACTTWSQLSRSKFSGVSVSLEKPVQLTFVEDESPDYLRDLDPTLPTYSALKARAPYGAALLTPVNYTENLNANFTIGVTSQLGASSLALAVPLFKHNRQSVTSKGNTGMNTCTNVLKGIYDPQTSICHVWDALVAVCVQIGPASTAGMLGRETWALDTSRGGYGCSVQSNWQQAGQYSRLPATGSDWRNPFIAPVPFPNVNFTVRSSADPFLVAQSLTGSSLNFGMSRKDAEAMFWGFLIAGILCTGQPVMRWYSTRYYRSRGHLKLRDDGGINAGSGRGRVGGLNLPQDLDDDDDGGDDDDQQAFAPSTRPSTDTRRNSRHATAEARATGATRSISSTSSSSHHRRSASVLANQAAAAGVSDSTDPGSISLEISPIAALVSASR